MSELEYHTCVKKCEGLGLGESLGISECMGRSGDGERGLKAWLYQRRERGGRYDDDGLDKGTKVQVTILACAIAVLDGRISWDTLMAFLVMTERVMSPSILPLSKDRENQR